MELEPQPWPKGLRTQADSAAAFRRKYRGWGARTTGKAWKRLIFSPGRVNPLSFQHHERAGKFFFVADTQMTVFDASRCH